MMRDFANSFEDPGAKVESASLDANVPDRLLDAVVVLDFFGQQAVFLLKR